MSTRCTPLIAYDKEKLMTYQGSFFSEVLEDNEDENPVTNAYMQLDLKIESTKKLQKQNKMLNVICKINPNQLMSSDNQKKIEDQFENDPEKELSENERNELESILKINKQKLKVLDFLTYCCSKST